MILHFEIKGIVLPKKYLQNLQKRDKNVIQIKLINYQPNLKVIEIFVNFTAIFKVSCGLFFFPASKLNYLES